MTFIADDVVLDAPAGRLTGIQAYRAHRARYRYDGDARPTLTGLDHSGRTCLCHTSGPGLLGAARADVRTDTAGPIDLIPCHNRTPPSTPGTETPATS
ncbi:hypothetical protein [Dactylosporangium roseum]|nr:hypothetical protein [Dactylosporangium roseum]